MNCFHCGEGIDEDAVPINSGADFMHRECMLRGVIGSEDHVRRGPHVAGACPPDEPALTKREAALAAYLAWLECGQKSPAHIDAPGADVVRKYLPLDDSPCYGALGPALMLYLLAELTRFPVEYLSGKPVEWLYFIFFTEFTPLRRRMRFN